MADVNAVARRPRRRPARAVAAIGLLAALTACGGSDADDTDMRVDAGAVMDTTPGGTAAPPTLPSLAGDSRRQTTVTLREWEVALADDALPAGEVTFQAMNTGTAPHALAVQGPDIDARTEPIEPGGTAALTLQLAPGTYRLFCPDAPADGRHDERGMSTPLVAR